MSDDVTEVGARLVLENAAKFRADLDASRESVAALNEELEAGTKVARSYGKAFGDAQAVVADSLEEGDAARTKAVASMDEFNDAQAATADVSRRTAATIAASSKASAEGAAAIGIGATSSLKTLEKLSTKVLKWSAGIAGVVGYEGIKNFMAFQQQITQMGVDAGVKKSQLPAFAKIAMSVSDATGLAAVNVGDMMYRIASANPKIHITTKAMSDMATAAGQLNVLAGNTGDFDSIGRLYGAIVSNGLSLNRGGKALTYNATSGKQINEWALATAGHGDLTTGALVSAMGTGLLPIAKTYGLSLNDVGAMLDVLTPAMNANSAATRLKTAIGMLGSPSQKAVEAAELVGGNATTMGGLLRTKGPAALMNYLANLENKAMSGKTFIGGGIYGAESGKYSGISGAADWLKAYGFTNSKLVSVLQSRGIGALKTMGSTELQTLGFSKGITGQQAAKTVLADILGEMFGGGRTGAAILQEVNERGVLTNHESAITSTENPTAYEKAIKLAYAEPIVTFHRFEQQLKNLTITVGQDVTPAFDDFLHDLEAFGRFMGNNKWLLDALGIGTAGLVAGAAVVKGAEVVRGVVSGARAIQEIIKAPSSLFSGLGGSSLNSAGLSLNEAAVALKGAAVTMRDGSIFGDTGGAGGAAITKDLEKAGMFSELGSAAGYVAGFGLPAALMLAFLLHGTKLGHQVNSVLKHPKKTATSAWHSAVSSIDSVMHPGKTGLHYTVQNMNGTVSNRTDWVSPSLVGQALLGDNRAPKRLKSHFTGVRNGVFYAGGVPQQAMMAVGQTSAPKGNTPAQSAHIRDLMSLGESSSTALISTQDLSSHYKNLFDGPVKQLQASADEHKQASDTDKSTAATERETVNLFGSHVSLFAAKVASLNTSLDPAHLTATVINQIKSDNARH